MTMFDIEDSKDVNLSQNKTRGANLLRARRVENLTANDNVAAAIEPVSQELPRRFKWFFDNIVVAVVGGAFLIVIVAVLVWKFPQLQPFLKG